MRIDFVTLFPQMVQDALQWSIAERARVAGAVEYRTVNPRDFCYDRHLKVDDVPFGGEPGMLMRAEPVALAIESCTAESSRAAIVLTAPTGDLFSQAIAKELSGFEQIVFLCGHYEGIDHRIETTFATHVLSIGDYVLTNGEMPALVMADAVVRLLPGVLGSAESLAADSHSNGLLSAPNFTRPSRWRDQEVPEVLLSGNHAAIAQWRRVQSLRTTLENRPDLFAKADLVKVDLDLLKRSED